MIDFRGKEVKQVAPSVPKEDAPTKRSFYALQTKGSKLDQNGDNDEGNSLHFILVI